MMVGFERNHGRDQWMWERPSTVVRAELVLAVAVQTYDAEGEPHLQRYHLRLDPKGEGIFPVVAFDPPRREAELWMIDPLALRAAHE